MFINLSIYQNHPWVIVTLQNPEPHPEPTESEPRAERQVETHTFSKLLRCSDTDDPKATL